MVLENPLDLINKAKNLLGWIIDDQVEKTGDSPLILSLGQLENVIREAILLMTTRPRSSTETSAGSATTGASTGVSSGALSMLSLGETIAPYDKQILKSYAWVPRGETNSWAKGNDFRTWIESRLPQPKASLNCWEAVMVILSLYNALDKREVAEIYEVNLVMI